MRYNVYAHQKGENRKDEGRLFVTFVSSRLNANRIFQALDYAYAYDFDMQPSNKETIKK